MPTVLITGANRGLGLEFVRQYAGERWRVLACCRKPSDGDELAALAKVHEVVVQQLDITDFDAVDALAKQWSDEPIDVLINNAGLFGPKVQAENDWRQSFGHMDYDIWLQVLNTNLLAPLKMAEAFVAQVAASEQKKIVTISSVIGSIAGTETGLYAYRTSKAGVNMAMATLANELRSQDIAVAVFCPGWVRTRMGGKDATVAPRDSIAGLRKLIDQLQPGQSSQFRRYNGDLLAW